MLTNIDLLVFLSFWSKF